MYPATVLDIEEIRPPSQTGTGGFSEDHEAFQDFQPSNPPCKCNACRVLWNSSVDKASKATRALTHEFRYSSGILFKTIIFLPSFLLHVIVTGCIFRLLSSGSYDSQDVALSACIGLLVTTLTGQFPPTALLPDVVLAVFVSSLQSPSHWLAISLPPLLSWTTIWAAVLLVPLHTVLPRVLPAGLCCCHVSLLDHLVSGLLLLCSAVRLIGACFQAVGSVAGAAYAALWTATAAATAGMLLLALSMRKSVPEIIRKVLQTQGLMVTVVLFSCT